MKQTSLQHKVVVCFLTGLTGAYALFELSRKILQPWMSVVNVLCLSFFLIATTGSIFWHHREKKQDPRVKTLSLIQALLSYFIGIILSMFAWRKILGMHFYIPQALLDKPASSLKGEQLMSAFFGSSYPFELCIGLSELAGALLLLFTKTRLLGVLILVPVIANIILIDIIYDVAAGALIMATVLMSGLLYFVILDRRKLAALFSSTKERFSSTPIFNIYFKAAIRLSVLIIPMAIALVLYDYPNRHPDLSGKYSVVDLKINNRRITANSCEDSVLTLVYFDNNNDLCFEYNSQKRWKIAHFNFNETTRQLTAIWRFPGDKHDTLFANLSSLNLNREMILSGYMGKDTLQVKLQRDN